VGRDNDHTRNGKKRLDNISYIRLFQGVSGV